MNIQNINKIHFIGIGGIGVSAIARMMLLEGKAVSGSDLASSMVSEELEKSGARIFIGHNRDNLQGADLVVYTGAISPENSEFLKAQELVIPLYSYPEFLGIISKNKFTIAISGTHGKTTTTAMVAKILIDAGFDPTVVVGSFLKDQKSNFIAGKSKYFVVEACEYRRSFLNLNPNIVAITNIEEDHLDYYRDLKDIEGAFGEFAKKLSDDGTLIYPEKYCGLAQGKAKDYTKEDVSGLKLTIPGAHNIENAKVALAIAKTLGIDREMAIRSLNSFSGTWRRFEYKGKMQNGALLYDDYAHHPSEIKATLSGAREFFGSKNIICVFQPHLFSRTRLLLEEFSESFSDASQVILADIYAAREKYDENINSKMLAEKINSKSKNAIYLSSFDAIKEYLENTAKDGDVIITMGAGDVYRIGETLLG